MGTSMAARRVYVAGIGSEVEHADVVDRLIAAGVVDEIGDVDSWIEGDLDGIAEAVERVFEAELVVEVREEVGVREIAGVTGALVVRLDDVA